MSDSTSLLDTISTSQAQKEVTANALFDAASTSILFARRASTSSALTWGFYGGTIFIGGARTAIANGTVALTASTTNYVEVDAAGVVAVATSQTAGKMLLYAVVTGASTVTSYTDQRSSVAMASFFFQYVAVAMADANQTLTQAQGLCATIDCTGALTAGRNLVVSTRRTRFAVHNNTTGGFAVTVKTSAGTGVPVAMGDRSIVECDGTNVVLVANSSSTYVLPTATASVLGGVKVGDGLNIASQVLSAHEAVNVQTGTSYTYVTGDKGKLVRHNNAAAIAGSLPQAGASFPDGWFMDVLNYGAGTLTITPTTSMIDGQTNLVLTTGQGVRIISDNTNYFTIRGAGGYTLPIASASVLGGVKVGSGLSIDGGGVLSASGSAPSTATLTDFAQDTGTTTGLTYGFQAGRIREGATTTNVAAGTILLTASTTNYVEVSGAGTVSTNTTGFTNLRYSMATVVTGASTITTVTDKRGVITVSSSLGDMLSVLTASEVAVTGTVTLDSTAFGKMHKCSGTTADYTVTLPAASGNSGKFIGFRMEGGLTKLVTLDGNASETIDGTTTRIMWANETAVLMCDGTGWVKIFGKSIPMFANMKRTTAQSITNATETIVAMGSTVDDNSGLLADTTNGRVNIKRPGIYNCSGFVTLESMASGNSVSGGVSKNAAGGNDSPNASNNFSVSGSGFVAASSAANFKCVAGDFIVTWVFHNNGASKNTRTAATVQPTLSVAEIPSW